MNFIKDYSEIVICDIGASPCDPTDHIEELLNNTNSFQYGFEPNEEEFKKLNTDRQKDNRKFFKEAIGDGLRHNLNICSYPGWTSFLIPDIDYIKKFHNFENASKIIETVNLKTKKLDDVVFKKKIDFIKIDTQGFESIVIEHGKKTISDALVVQLELSPIPIYKKEKSFSYVSNQMEKMNFSLNMFHNINTRTLKPMVVGGNTGNGLKTIFQLDCVFVKNYSIIEELTIERLKKLILIMFYSYKSFDFVDYLISLLDKKQKTDLIKDFRNLIPSLKLEKKY